MGCTESTLVQQSNPMLQWNQKGDLGSGSYGAVKALERRSDRFAAAGKVATVESTESLIGFQNEIKLLSMCYHPNITRFIEAYFFESELWIIIEKATGGSMSSVLDKRPKGLAEPEVAACAYQLLDAVAYLHGMQIIHRDINAANTLISQDGLIKLADFGVSTISKKNKQGTFIGSPMWMAPEVIKCETDPNNRYTNKCDVWGLGVTVIEFGDGHPPNHDMHPAKAIMRITSGAPPNVEDPTAWSPAFPAFIARVMVRDAAARPEAAELMSDPFVSGGPQRQVLVAMLN